MKDSVVSYTGRSTKRRYSLRASRDRAHRPSPTSFLFFFLRTIHRTVLLSAHLPYSRNAREDLLYLPFRGTSSSTSLAQFLDSSSLIFFKPRGRNASENELRRADEFSWPPTHSHLLFTRRSYILPSATAIYRACLVFFFPRGCESPERHRTVYL